MKKNSKIFSDNPLVSPKTPFGKNCFPKLKNLAHSLTQILEIESQNKPTIISIDAPYGAGKTTFIDMWGQDLLNHDKLAIKFDAWKADYSDDPLITLISSITSALKELNQTNKSNRLIGNIIKSGKQVCEASLHVTKFVKTALIQQAGIGDAVDKLQKELSGFYVGSLFNAHAERSAVLKNFKTQFSTLIKSLQPQHPTIFIFIDELDRCKPLFAIQLMEIVKHIFDIHGTCFILVMNAEAMESSIQAIYGQKFDACGYLERFVDFPIYLPPNSDEYINNALINIASSFPNNLNKNSISYCVGNFQLVPRVINKYLKDIKLFLLQNNNVDPLPEAYFPAIIYLLGLKRASEAIYQQFIKNGFDILNDNFLTGINQFLSNKRNFETIRKIKEANNDIEWSLKFLYASKNEDNLNKLANELADRLLQLDRLDAKTQETQKLIFFLEKIKKIFIDEIYGGLWSLRDSFVTQNDKPKLKCIKNHFVIAQRKLNFLDYLEVTTTKIPEDSDVS